MVDNIVIVDLQKMKDSPEYFRKKMIEAGHKVMIYGDAIWEIVDQKITNWRKVIEDGR